MAKRDPMPGQPEGVCVLDSTDLIIAARDRVELGDLWGVARGTIRRLARLDIAPPCPHPDPPNIRKRNLFF